MSGIYDADIESSTYPVPNRFILSADIDGNGQHELIAVPEPGYPNGPDPNTGRILQYQYVNGFGYRFVEIGTIDCATSSVSWNTGVAADFDGDQRDEVLGLPDLGQNPQAIGAWTMDYNLPSRQWRHFGPIANHPFEADFVWSSSMLTTAFALAADVNGDGRAEIVLAPRSNRFNELWIMAYNAAAGTWNHFSPLTGGTDRNYTLAAYNALLTGLGTSYAELRLGSGALQSERALLAERLGVPETALGDFLVSSVDLNQSALETIFGLPSTIRDPFAPRTPSVLERRRRERLAALWLAQDWPQDPYLARELPIIDPDLTGPDDFRAPVAKLQPGDPDGAFDLWLQRRAFVDQERARLRAVAPKTVSVAATNGADPIWRQCSQQCSSPPLTDPRLRGRQLPIRARN